MVFEQNFRKCLTKAGERCKFAVGGGDDSRTIYEDAPCVGNAECSSEGFCICDSRYYEMADGQCALASDLNEHCDARVKCSVYKALYCNSGLCKCHKAISEYDYGLQQCVGLAEERCVNEECTSNASCLRGTCICDEDYYRGEDKRCHRKIAVKKGCTADYQCEQRPFMELKCVKGLCDCDPSDSMYATVYQSDLRNSRSNGYYGFRKSSPNVTQCVPLAGQPCIKGLCTPGAYCLYDRNPNYYSSADQQRANGTCECLSDRVRSKNNRCGYTVSKPCQSGDDCMDGLVCKNMKCACPIDTQFFREEDKVCYNKFNGPCTEDTECDKNAHCKVAQQHSQFGHCKCNEGFIANATGDCEVAHGGPCTNIADCDSVAGLDCINNVCECGGFERYNVTRRKCLKKVGAACELSADEQACVDNASCISFHSKIRGICQCNEGSYETENYTCSDKIIYSAITEVDAVIDQDAEPESPTRASANETIILPSLLLWKNVLEVD